MHLIFGTLSGQGEADVFNEIIAEKSSHSEIWRGGMLTILRGVDSVSTKMLLEKTLQNWFANKLAIPSSVVAWTILTRKTEGKVESFLLALIILQKYLGLLQIWSSLTWQYEERRLSYKILHLDLNFEKRKYASGALERSNFLCAIFFRSIRFFKDLFTHGGKVLSLMT